MVIARCTLSLLVLLMLSGCKRLQDGLSEISHKTRRGTPGTTETRTQVASVPVPDGVPVRLRGRLKVGELLGFEPFAVIDTITLRTVVTPHDTHAVHSEFLPFTRQWFLQRFVLDSSARESLFVIIEHIRSLQHAVDRPSTHRRYVLLHNGRVAKVFSGSCDAAPSGEVLSPLMVRAIDIPFASGRSVIVVRTETLLGPKGNELFQVFGLSHQGEVRTFEGPLGYIKDGDLPSSLHAGQVAYTYIRIGCIRVPLPLTFEPQNCRFVAEVGEDALFPATGEGEFTGGRDGSEQIQLFSAYRPGAPSLQASIPLNSKVKVHRAYLPWFVTRRGEGVGRETGWVFVEVNNLAGWIPDSLFQRTGLMSCQ